MAKKGKRQPKAKLYRHEQPADRCTGRRWKPVALAVILIAVVGGSVSLYLIIDARSELAALKGRWSQSNPAFAATATADHLRGPQDETAGVFELLVFRAKARPGTQEALAMLERETRFDVLRANLLIAKGIPRCERIDHERINAWYETLAQQIRQHAGVVGLTSEGRQFVAQKGVPEFMMACANEVITRMRKISYADNDQTQAELPWHLFAHGVAQKEKGTCVTMAVMWKIVADKLGWPMHLRNAPTHLYLAWQDGRYETNLEATDSAKPVKDKVYRQREGISDEDYEKGRYMKNLTSRQILAAFVSTRAYHWHAVDEPIKEFEDLLLAAELDPVCPAYRTNLVKTWPRVGGLIEKEFQNVVGQETLAAVQRERMQSRARERARGEAEAQMVRMKAQSGIPEVKRVTGNPLLTPGGDGLPDPQFDLNERPLAEKNRP